MINILRKISGLIKHSEAYSKEYLSSIYTMEHPEIQCRMNIPTRLPSSLSLLNLDIPVIDDQGQEGTCYAFAVGDDFEYEIKNPIAPAIGSYKDLSKTYLAYWSRYILGGNKPPVGDNGSTILATFQALQQYGMCLTSTLPYETSLENVRPSDSAIAEGKNLEVGKYFAIPEDDNKLTAIKTSLSAGVPLAYGSPVHNSIFSVSANGVESYASPTSKVDKIVGDHARKITGFNDNMVIPGAPIKGAFEIKNSWGPGWGKNGVSYVSYQTWLDNETDDMGITSINSPVTPPSGNIDVARALSELGLAYKATSVKTSRPLIKSAETYLGGT
jgi:C1A family cysteine protease